MRSKIYTMLFSLLVGLLVVTPVSSIWASEPIESIQDTAPLYNTHFAVAKTRAKAILNAGYTHKKKILSVLSVAGGACAVIYAAQSGVQIPYWTNVNQATTQSYEQKKSDNSDSEPEIDEQDPDANDSPSLNRPEGDSTTNVDQLHQADSTERPTDDAIKPVVTPARPSINTVQPAVAPINPSMTDDWIPTPYHEALARPEDRKYTVNLMWLNRKLERNQQFIHPAANEELLREKLLDPVIQWAINTQGGTVNLWFDSFLTPPEAVQRTRLIIDQLIEQQAYSAPILLRDIRNLPEVQQNSEVFSAQTPVYFRVDLVRAIIEVNSIRTKETEAAVAADVDMQPLTCDQLFDSETIGNLEKNGIVMARNKRLGFENGFQIVSQNNPNLIEAMQHALIDLNIERGKVGLAGQILNGNGRIEYNTMRPLQQIVYESYPKMFQYFYHLEGRGELTIEYPPDRRGRYDKNTAGLCPGPCHTDFDCSHSTAGKAGLWPFDLHRVNINSKILSFTAVDQSIQDEWGGALVPTKAVPLPPAGLNYD